MVNCPTCGTPILTPVARPGLAGRNLAIVNAVAEHWRRYGIAPTIREIADATGLRSTSTVQYHVNRLIVRGHLIRTPNAQRSLRLPTGDLHGNA